MQSQLWVMGTFAKCVPLVLSFLRPSICTCILPAPAEDLHRRDLHAAYDLLDRMAKIKTKRHKKDAADQSTQSACSSIRTLSDLRANSDLWYKICVLVWDFGHVKTDHASMNRLSQVTDAQFISGPYFTPEQAAAVKNATVDTETGTTVEKAISDKSKDFNEKRAASGDHRPCGPHDMLPVYLECFGIEKTEIQEGNFVSRVRRSGVGWG